MKTPTYDLNLWPKIPPSSLPALSKLQSMFTPPISANYSQWHLDFPSSVPHRNSALFKNCSKHTHLAKISIMVSICCIVDRTGIGILLCRAPSLWTFFADFTSQAMSALNFLSHSCLVWTDHHPDCKHVLPPANKKSSRWDRGKWCALVVCDTARFAIDQTPSQ